MARVNGRSPAGLKDEDYRPPHLPWVLLCHTSSAACGHVFTVNTLKQWADALNKRRAHENLCTAKPRPVLILPGDPVT